MIMAFPSGSPRLRRLFLGLATLGFWAGGPTTSRAEQLIGLTSNNGLVTFDSATPGTPIPVVAVTGLQAGETLIGIDIRPTTGLLYAVGDSNRLYTLDRMTGMATLQALLTPAPGSTFTALAGSFFGLDFNPVPDLAGMASLRVISDTGQNLRINVNPGVAGQTFMDGTINPAGTTITGSAYANNDLDPATGTTLFGINPAANTLLRSTDANAGTYVTVDPLGFNVDEVNGFDISGPSAVAYAAFVHSGSVGSSLFTIDYTTPDGSGVNRATLVGAIGTPLNIALRGLAAPGAIPEPSTWVLMGMGLVALSGYARWRRAGVTPGT
jgi:hypothetical protein